MVNINIRNAVSSDFDSVKELMLNALQTDPTAFNVSFEEYNSKDNYWWHGYLDPFLFGDLQQLIIAEEKERVIGSAGIIFDERKRKSHIGTFVWFYVLPEYRKQGIGKSLLEMIMDITSKKNLIKLTLMANETQQSAIKLYERYGFNLAGKLEKEIKIDNEYYRVVIMEKLL